MQVGSFVLFVVSAFGVWLTGNSRRWGWRFAICNQPLFIVWGLLTYQYGSIATSVVFVALYVRNLRKLAREEAAAEAAAAGAEAPEREVVAV